MSILHRLVAYPLFLLLFIPLSLVLAIKLTIEGFWLMPLWAKVAAVAYLVAFAA